VPENIKGQRVLVTGAAGFIGFHLAKKLHRTGNLVVGLDAFNDYYDQELKRVRANYLTHDLDVEVVEGNVCDKQLLKQLFEKHRFTHVAHLAAQAGVRYSLENPQSYVTNNLMCLTNLFEVVREINPKVVFVYASSSSVYGRNKKVPFSEKDAVDHPSNVYGASKKANEAWALVYHDLFGIKVTGLRFFTVYGPFGRPDMAIYLWANSISKNEPLRLYEKKDSWGRDVELKRDFTYVDDIVDGVIGCLSLGADHEVFNLGNNTPEPITRLIDYLGEGLGRPHPKRTLKPLPSADITMTFADISHAQRRIGFEPKTKLKDGVRKFVSWYRDYYYPSNVIMLFVRDDATFKEWYTTKGNKKLPNTRYYIFHSKKVSQRLVNQYTQMNMRFRSLPQDQVSSVGQLAGQYLEFLENMLLSTPRKDWELKRVAMFLQGENVSFKYDASYAEQSLFSQTDKSLIYMGTTTELQGAEWWAGCSKPDSIKDPVSAEALAGEAHAVVKLLKYTLKEDSVCFPMALNDARQNNREFS